MVYLAFVCALASLAMNIFLIRYLRRYGALSLPFFVALLLVFSLPNLAAPLLFKGYEEHIYLISSAISFSFLSFFFCLQACFFKLGVMSKVSNNNLTIDINIYYACLFMFVSSFVLFLALFEFDYGLMISSGWAEFRAEQSVLKLLATYLLCPSSGLLLASIVLRRKVGIFVVFCYLVFSVVVLKTRSYIALIVLPCLFYYVLFGRWGVKRTVGLLLIAVIFLFIYSVAREIRHLGGGESISELSFNIDTQEFELIDNLYYIIDNRAKIYDSDFNDIRRLLLFPFPAEVLNFSKPRENAKVLWDERTGRLGLEGSLHPNFFGNIAAESILWGWLVYAFLFAILFLFLHKFFFFLQSSNLIVFSAIVAVSFYIARGAFFNGVMLLVFSMCVAVLAELFLRFCVFFKKPDG